jgi:flagellar biosynthesis protein FlhF
VIAFVGPTGVGKTTTLVKIAARLRRNKKKVTLATLDTYRVGAVEQLRTYAEILGVYNRVISSAEGLANLWKNRREGEYILMDTAGRSPFHEQEIAQLAMLTGVPVETHLVLSASTRPIDLEETVDCFRAIPIDRIIFTKLDETKRYGHIFGVIRKSRIRPSYITTGQRVPEDMEEVTAEGMTRWVFPT